MAAKTGNVYAFPRKLCTLSQDGPKCCLLMGHLSMLLDMVRVCFGFMYVFQKSLFVFRVSGSRLEVDHCVFCTQ